MDYTRNRFGAQAQAASYDAGLRAYMLQVFNYMTAALGLTGIVAFAVSTSPAILQVLYSTPLGFIVALAPIGFVIFMSIRLQQMSLQTAQITFWIFSVVMGLSLSYIFVAYTGTSIARVFFITAGTFGAMSLWGYTTKRDLSGMGSFLFMGLIGVIIALVVNLFLKSSGLEFAISLIGLIIFIGLTAYDIQRVKQTYFMLGSTSEMARKVAIMGALNLYMDFINLFLHLLRFMGDRR